MRCWALLIAHDDRGGRGGNAGLPSCNAFLIGGAGGFLGTLTTSLVEDGGVLTSAAEEDDGLVEDVAERNDSGFGLGVGGTDFADCGVRGGSAGGVSCDDWDSGNTCSDCGEASVVGDASDFNVYKDFCEGFGCNDGFGFPFGVSVDSSIGVDVSGVVGDTIVSSSLDCGTGGCCCCCCCGSCIAELSCDSSRSMRSPNEGRSLSLDIISDREDDDPGRPDDADLADDADDERRRRADDDRGLSEGDDRRLKDEEDRR